MCRVFVAKATDPKKAEEIRFQNIKGAAEKMLDLFSVDFAAGLDSADWVHLQDAFQKRHLLAHKMGVVDASYQKATGVSPSLIGREFQSDRKKSAICCVCSEKLEKNFIKL